MRISHTVFVSFCFWALTNALVEVISPPEIAGIYPDAPMNINPRKFDITAELVFPGEELCLGELDPTVNISNRIVFLVDYEICTATDLAKKILYTDPTALGMCDFDNLLISQGQIAGCFDRACSVLGHLEAGEFQNDMSVQFPTLNFNDHGIIYEYMHRENRLPVIVRMRDTSYNPWLAIGDGPAGQFTQVFFEGFALVCLCLCGLKLYVFIKFQSFRANVTQTCLWMEALAAISNCRILRLLIYQVRMFWMIDPLDFGKPFMPWPAATWFVDTPNVLSLLSTLLITFYWQEIISVMGDRLSNKLINNLSKFRIPFLLLAVLVVVLHVLATTNSFLYFIPDNAYTISAIISLIVSFFISVFFLYIGYKIFTVTDKRNKAAGERKANRVSKFILVSAFFMMVRILSLILYLSPAAGNGRSAYFGIWWLTFISAWSLSFAKIMAFEPPPNASKSFGSYFRRPNRFFRAALNKYLGWSMTVNSDKSGGDIPMSSNTDKSDRSGTLNMSKSQEDDDEEVTSSEQQV